VCRLCHHYDQVTIVTTVTTVTTVIQCDSDKMLWVTLVAVVEVRGLIGFCIITYYTYCVWISEKFLCEKTHHSILFSLNSMIQRQRCLTGHWKDFGFEFASNHSVGECW
jgi:hypothetical protein